MGLDRDKYLDLNEVKQLRTVTEAQCIIDLKKGRTKGILTWMVVDMALGTGLRVAELAQLKIEDINFKRGSLKVVRVKKKKKTRETLAIGKDLLNHLREYLEWLDETKGHLFLGQRGRLSAQGLQQIWKRAIERAGLPKELSIHSARHTCGTHLLRKTKNLRQVQKQLGHASPVITANMYADVSFDDMQEGMNGLYDDEQ